jgi:hypothetical protein
VGSSSLFPWKIPVYAELDASGKVQGGTIPTKTVFRGSFQPLYAGYDLLYPDVFRYQVWKRDFDAITKLQKETGKDTLPALALCAWATTTRAA